MRKENGQEIPLDTFSKHLYRQPALTLVPAYPEVYRVIKEVNGDKESHSLFTIEGLKRRIAEFSPKPVREKYPDADEPPPADIFVTSPIHAPAGMESPKNCSPSTPDKSKHFAAGNYSVRPRAQSIDVHQIEDEVEDTQEQLEAYFQQFVLPLAQANPFSSTIPAV